MPEVVSFIGWHDSGKTTLLCKVIEILETRGWKVASIKSSSHESIGFDKEGTDTWRLKQAGAEPVAIATRDQLVVMAKNTGMPLRTLAQRLFPDADIVLAEGFKEAVGVDKIEVCPSSQPELFRKSKQVVAVVSEDDPPGVMIFRPDEAEGLADFIEERYILPDRDKPSASLVVNGKAIPLKFFVQQAIAGAVSGLVDALKGTSGAQTIEILVKLPGPGR